MPGIAGIITKARQEGNARTTQAMLGCMMHESFYNSTTYNNEQLGIYAGAVCHIDSFADCLPIFNEQKDLVLLFSGENFVDNTIIARLRMQGHKCDYSNASYLIHLYEEDKEQFIKQLNGLFSGILIDLQENKILLFNDRYGMQRIYYHEDESNFYFSSEAKSLLKVCPRLRKIDAQGLGEFVSCGCVLQNRTLFPKIFLLPGGSVWTFENCGIVKKDNFFSPSIWENQPILGKEAFYERLKENFVKTLPRYFQADKPVGMSVTGGLDSRMIHACVDSSQIYSCYTFGGLYRDCLDVSIGREVATACKQHHEVLRLDNNFFKDFPEYAAKTVYVTDGCYDVCGTHDIYFNSLARKIAPIRVSGKFGGEVLRSVSNLKAVSPKRGLFNTEFYQHILNAKESVDEVKNGSGLTTSLFKAIPWGMYGCYAAEKSQISFRSPYMDNDFVRLIYQAPADVLRSNEISLQLIADNNQSLAYILTDRGFGGKQVLLLAKIYELFYYSLFKIDWYYGVGMPDWMSKIESKYGLSFFRNVFLGTQRIDHYRMWFQNELSEYVQNVLLDKTSLERSYINKNTLQYVVESHINGTKNNLNELKIAITIELIHRNFIDTN